MTTKHYGGKILLDFDEVRHRFTIAGKPIISVTACTSVIDKSTPLMFWAVRLTKDFLIERLSDLVKSKSPDEILAFIDEASKQHTIKKEKAGTVGTAVHAWIEGFIKAKLNEDVPELPKDQQVLNAVTAFMKWVDEHKVKFLSSERKVYSKKYNYAGIMDAEAIINGQKSVIDFKTSNAFYPEMRYQVAAYQAAVEEEEKEQYDGDKWIVRVGKDTGEFEAKQFDNQDKDFKVFLACLAIRRREKELSSKKI